MPSMVILSQVFQNAIQFKFWPIENSNSVNRFGETNSRYPVGSNLAAQMSAWVVCPQGTKEKRSKKKKEEGEGSVCVDRMRTVREKKGWYSGGRDVLWKGGGEGGGGEPCALNKTSVEEEEEEEGVGGGGGPTTEYEKTTDRTGPKWYYSSFWSVVHIFFCTLVTANLGSIQPFFWVCCHSYMLRFLEQGVFLTKFPMA